ncbi:hypothetical protein OAI91_00535 [bacterium]|nr:hypothetical protein [bacterium]
MFGDKTILQPEMVITVDDSVTEKKTFLVQVGDIFTVTGNGYEPLTDYAKNLDNVVC